MTKRRRILHADKIIQNVVHIFCLLMFLQLKGYYSVASNPILLYSTASDIRVANLSRLGKANAIVKGLEQGSAVDFIHRKNLICWSDQTAELIQCMNYNETHSGEKLRIVSEGLITPTGIAIDWYTDKIYWTDGETNRIEVISIDQKYRKVLFWSEVDLARAIAVVPKEGLMFWTDWGEEPKIEKAGMNGDPKTRKIIVKNDIIWPNGITIDYNNNLIFWVDAKLHFIDVVDFNGENRKRIIKGGLEYPYALTIFSDKFYWTDWKNWSIYTWDMTTNGPIKVLIKSDPVPVDIKVYDGSRQLMPTGDYPCKVNNGGCSHLCLLSPNDPGYVCACPTGTKLKEDGNTTCYSNPQSLLIVAQRSMISKISLDSPDFTPFTLPLKDLKRALTVDFDPKTEYIYWADSLAKTISRARLDGSEQSVVIHSSGVPDSIAVDPLARNIYWSDPVSDTISVARLDGRSKRVIIHEELYDPRAIALHPTAGWMFWSDWNEKKPKIERANLDGTGRMLLVSEKLTWPNGIALDTVNNKLYWGDARTHKIEVCNMDGSNRREIHNSDILHIFGLTLLGEHLYWTDMQRRTLDRINKVSGVERQPVVEQLANMMGVKAFRMGEPLGHNPCVDNNGGCSHLCFNRPKDYVCSCPLGLELGNDRKTCTEPEAFLVYSRKNVIGRISIENENNDAVLPIKDLKEVSALEVHVSGSKIYWSDSKTKTINRCSVNGSNLEKILEWMGIVEGLAIDWSGQNIYWTDTATQRVEMARLDGSSRRTLAWQGLKKPKSIVLDPRKGFMYWSELGSKTIKRAAMDGSSPSVFVEQVGRVHALAVDYDKRALYWAALDPPAIEYIYLNGTGRKMLADNISMPYALTLYGDKVFWGDWNTGLIEVAKKTDGSQRKTIHTSLDYITDLKVYHRTRAAGANQCGVDNGGCSHLCLPLPPGDYRCACPTHYRLNPDNLTCSEPEEFLLFAQKNAVGRILVANGECNDAIVPLTGLKNVKAIEFDPEKKLLYWMDEDSHLIRRVPISYSSTSALSDSSSLVSGVSRPSHMALDALGRALYWTGLDSDAINATHIDNNSSTVVILRGDSMRPRHLAFHQTKRSSQVERCSPSHMALDALGRALYWTGLDSDAINATHIDNNSSTVVILRGDSMRPRHLAFHQTKRSSQVERCSPSHMALDALGRALNWTDLDSDAINATHIDNNSSTVVILRGDSMRPRHLAFHQTKRSPQVERRSPSHMALDALGRALYWTGLDSDAINATHIDNNSSTVVILRGDSMRPRHLAFHQTKRPLQVVRRSPSHMALDALGRALYWTGLDSDAINATHIDNNSSTVVILRGDSMRPRHLAFHQTKRVLVWNDVGLGAIMRSNVDGTERVELARAANATALTIDQTSALVYWAVNRQILAIDLDTLNKRVVWQGGWVGTLSAYGGALYLGGGDRPLMRLPLQRRDTPAVLVPHVARLVASVAVHPMSRSHPCYGGRLCGGGPGACGAEGACGCGAACAPPRACAPRHFLCLQPRLPALQHQHCIPAEWQCDGQIDCPDGSDEGPVCGACAGGVRCTDGACADALSGCRAGAYCPHAPLPDAFRCDERLCLSPSLLCDGHQHCEDGSDEAPTFCTQKEQVVGSGRQSRALVVCGAVAACAGGVGGAWAALRHWRRVTASPRRRAPAVVRHKPRAPPTGASNCTESSRHWRRVTASPRRRAPAVVRHKPRAPPTGASNCTEASESLCERYPQPTANPPPSPATASGASSAAAAAARRRAYRHYRACNRPPPPTPASTDACESEPEPAARAPPPSPAPYP